MKKIISIFTVLAVALVMSACSSVSWDTIRFAGNTSKQVQVVECTISIAEPLPVKATKIKILEPVLFNFDKSYIRADQEPVIDRLAALMTEYPDTVLAIDGFASKEGAKMHNLKLSQRRADSVKAALVAMGIADDRITNVVGRGITTQFSDKLPPNRRVVVLSVE
jgi:outer membrane protein OmpA-like peptidoglycan-associated protein